MFVHRCSNLRTVCGALTQSTSRTRVTSISSMFSQPSAIVSNSFAIGNSSFVVGARLLGIDVSCIRRIYRPYFRIYSICCAEYSSMLRVPQLSHDEASSTADRRNRNPWISRSRRHVCATFQRLVASLATCVTTSDSASSGRSSSFIGLARRSQADANKSGRLFGPCSLYTSLYTRRYGASGACLKRFPLELSTTIRQAKVASHLLPTIRKRGVRYVTYAARVQRNAASCSLQAPMFRPWPRKPETMLTRRSARPESRRLARGQVAAVPAAATPTPRPGAMHRSLPRCPAFVRRSRLNKRARLASVPWMRRPSFR